MRLTIHRIVLICLIKISPKLFNRYYAEYHFVFNKYLRHKKVESVKAHLKELMKDEEFRKAYKMEKRRLTEGRTRGNIKPFTKGQNKPPVQPPYSHKKHN